MKKGIGGFYIPGQGIGGGDESRFAAAGFPVDGLPYWEITIAGVVLLPCKAAKLDITGSVEIPTTDLNSFKLGDLYIGFCARLAYEIGDTHIFAVPRNVLAKKWLQYGQGSRIASLESEWYYILNGLRQKGIMTKELMMIAHRNGLGVKYDPDCQISDPEPMLVFFKNDQAWKNFKSVYL